MGMFTTAQRTQAKVRIAIDGPSGSGKTYSALLIAKGLAGGDWAKVALIDTERGSGSLYADLGPYAYAMLAPPYTVEKYLTAIHGAEAEGFAVVVIDSMTHAWSGEGGVLDFVDKVAASQTRGNSFAAWKAGTPVQQKLIDAILASPCHVIATMRSKTEWVLEQNQQGKQVPKKVGLAPDQRKDVDYEFTVVLDLSREHVATASKDRTGLFDSRIEKPTEAMGQELLAWLAGASSAPAPQPIEQVDPAQLPIGPEAWSAMVTAAAGFGASPEQLLAEAAQYQHQGPGESMPRGLAEYVFTTARNRAAEAAQARQALQDQQREQAAAAQPAPAPAAAQPQPASSPPPAAVTQPAPAPAPEPVQAPWAPTPGEVITLSQAGNLRAMLHAKGYREEAVTGPLGIASIDMLPAARWDEVVAAVRSLPDPTPPQPGPTQMPQAPAPQGAARFPEGSEAAQQAEARSAERPDGCTMDTSYMRCTAIARGETPQCEGCEHFDPAWAPLDAATRRDAAPEHAPWGTVTKAGSIDADRLKKLAIKCGELEQLGVPAEAWREVMWREEKVTSRRELSKAAADRMLKYVSRWLTDVAAGTTSPTEREVA